MAAAERTAAGEAADAGDLPAIRVNQVEISGASCRNKNFVQRCRKLEIVESYSTFAAWKSYLNQSSFISRTEGTARLRKD